MTGIETSVLCPNCGETLWVVMEPYDEVIRDFSEIEKAMGFGKTNHFAALIGCSCGKKVSVSFHVTCIEGRQG